MVGEDVVNARLVGLVVGLLVIGVIDWDWFVSIPRQFVGLGSQAKFFSQHSARVSKIKNVGFSSMS